MALTLKQLFTLTQESCIKKSYDYIIRLDLKDKYVITKIDDDYVDAQYVVTQHRNDKLSCSCPSGSIRYYCKHTDMVVKFKKTGKTTF